MSDELYTVWYVVIFLSLIIMFILMAMYEHICAKPRPRPRRNSTDATPELYNEKPASPSPSYSKFAPPSYKDAVSKMDTKVYLVSSNYEVFFPYQPETLTPAERSPAVSRNVLPEVHHQSTRPVVATQTSITVEILQDDKR